MRSRAAILCLLGFLICISTACVKRPEKITDERTFEDAKTFCKALTSKEPTVLNAYLPTVEDGKESKRINIQDLPMLFPVDKCEIVEAVSDPVVFFMVADLQSGEDKLQAVFGLRRAPGGLKLLYIGAPLAQTLEYAKALKREPSIEGCKLAVGKVQQAQEIYFKDHAGYTGLSDLLREKFIYNKEISSACASISIEVNEGHKDYELTAIPKGYTMDECTLRAKPLEDIKSEGSECK